MLKQVAVHTSVMNELRKDFYATKIAQNGIDLLRAAREHVEALFELGQKLWAPFLHGPAYTQALRRRLTLGELNLGFDPWILTDAQQRTEHQGTNSETLLVEFWSGVKNPAQIAQLGSEILSLKQKGAIRRRYGRGYATPPWPSQFLVRESITIGGRQYKPGDLIAFFTRTLSASEVYVEIRKTGHLVKPLDLLGQPAVE